MDPRERRRAQAGPILLLSRWFAPVGARRGAGNPRALPRLQVRELLRHEPVPEEGEVGRPRIRGHVARRGRRTSPAGPLWPRQDAPGLRDPLGARREQGRRRAVRGLLRPPDEDPDELPARRRSLQGIDPPADGRGGGPRLGRARRVEAAPLGARCPLQPLEHALQPEESHDRHLEFRGRAGRRLRRAGPPRGPRRQPDPKPSLRDVSDDHDARRRFPADGRAGPDLTALNTALSSGRAAGLLALALALAGAACARVAPAPRDAAAPPPVSPPSAPATPAAPTPRSAPLAVPPDPAPSGILF